MDQAITIVYDTYGIGIFTNIFLANEVVNGRFCRKETFLSPALLCYRLQEIFRDRPQWDISKLKLNTYSQLAYVSNYNYQSQTASGGMPMLAPMWNQQMYIGGVPQDWRMY